MIPTDELRELLAKVTPGPWIADDFCEPDGKQVRVGTNDGTPEYYHRTAAVAYCQTNHDDDRWHDVPLIGQVNAEANASLIALAPFLADEVLRLRETIVGLEAENAALLHDLKRQMTIANVECNEAARLREMEEALVQAAIPLEALLIAQPYIELEGTSWAEIENGVASIRAVLKAQEQG